MTDVAIFASTYFERLSEDKSTAKKGAIVTLEKALTTKYKTQAVMACYTSSDVESNESEQYLLNDESLLFNPSIRVTMHYYVIDLDNDPHEPWEDYNVASSLAEHLHKTIGCSTYVSKAGIRLIYPLAKPVTAIAFKKLVARANKSFLLKYKSLITGMDLDTSNNQWHRVYKLPFITLSDGTKTAEFAKSFVSDKLFTEEELTDAPEVTVEELKAIEERPTQVTMSMEDKVLILSKFKAKLNKYKEAVYENITQGIAFFTPGTRNKIVFKVVSLLTRLLSEAAGEPIRPTIIYSLLYSSVEDTRGPTPAGESLEELWDVCVKAYKVIAAEFITKLEKKDKAKSYAESEDYLPPLVYKDQVYFVLNPDTGNYHYTNNSNAVPSLLEKGSHVTGVEVRGPKGAFLAMNELIAQYGEICEQIVYVLGSENPTFFNKEQRILYIKTGKAIEIEPEFNEEIDKWLYYLTAADSGNTADYEALLDWLATFLMLHRPTCGMYIKGKKGSGKGMLASALSAFFGTSPVSLGEALSGYNDGLINMPLVYQDEQAPSIKNMQSDLRSLLANSEHRLGGKYKGSMSLRGCPRLLVCANDMKAIPIDPKLTAESMQASIERIRFIQCSPKCAEYLESLGNYDYTLEQNWVSDGYKPGKIAKHVAWLMQNRQVETRGKRFIVNSVRTIWHDRLVINSDRANVTHALFKAISSEQAFSYIKVTEKSVFVSVSEFHRAWPILTGSSRVPDLSDLIEHFNTTFDVLNNSRVYFEGQQKRAMELSVASIAEAGRLVDTDYMDEFFAKVNKKDGSNKPVIK